MAFVATYTMTYTDQQVEQYIFAHQGDHQDISFFRQTKELPEHMDPDDLFNWLTDRYFHVRSAKWEREWYQSELDRPDF